MLKSVQFLFNDHISNIAIMIGNSSLNLLYAIRDCWGNSNNAEAKDRSQRLSRILNEKSEDEFFTGPWNSTMKVKPPQGVKADLQKEMER